MPTPTRRRLLGGIAAGIAAALAGCGGDAGGTRGAGPPQPPEDGGTDDRGGDFGYSTSTTPDPAPNLTVDDFALGSTDDGRLTVSATVRNVADRPASATLLVLVEVGERSFERRQPVSLSGGETTQYSYTFEATREAFYDDGSLDFDWTDGTTTTG